MMMSFFETTLERRSSSESESESESTSSSSSSSQKADQKVVVVVHAGSEDQKALCVVSTLTKTRLP